MYGEPVASSSKPLSSHLNVVCSTISRAKANSKEVSAMNSLHPAKGKYSRSFVGNAVGVAKLRNNTVIRRSKAGCLLENEIGMFNTERNDSLSKHSCNNNHTNNKEIEGLFREYDQMLKGEIDMLDSEAKAIEAVLTGRNELTPST